MKQGTDHPTPIKEALITCKVMFKYALFFGCIINLLMLASPIYSMQVLDRVISSGSTDTLVMLTLVIVLALLLLSLIQVGRSFAMTKMGEWLEIQLSEKLFANSVKSSLETKVNAGSQQMRDLQTIKSYLTSPGLLTMLDLPWAIIFIIVLFIIHPWIGWIPVIGGLILVGLAFISEKLTKPVYDSISDDHIKSLRQVDQATRNAEIIEVMGILPNVVHKWQKLNHKVQTAQVWAAKRQSAIIEITKFIRLFLQILVTGLGAYLVLQGEISTGAIIASSSLVGRALSPFENAMASWKGFVNSRKAYERLNSSLKFSKSQETQMSFPEPKGKIEVENLFYAPPNFDRHIVSGVSFKANPGEILLIVGPSGSGKTTLAKLIVGALQPSIGSIRIDEVNLKDWKRSVLGQYIGYVPQDTELFSGTIKENIARMDPNANDEDIIRAAESAGIHEIILKLPAAYDTEIGFDGSILSGGQRQRMALARALFGNPPILILDEPNSNLDNAGESALALALTAARESGVACIVISHRTGILNIADYIMVMQEGSIVRYGKREEIMQSANQQMRVANA